MAAKALSKAPSAHFFAKASNSASVASASVVRPVASWKVLITAAFSSAVCAALRPAIFPSPSANATSASGSFRANAASASGDASPIARPAAFSASGEVALTHSRRTRVKASASASAASGFFTRPNIALRASSSPSVNERKSTVRPVPALAAAWSSSASEATSPLASATRPGGKNAAAPSGSAAISRSACRFCATSAFCAAASPRAANLTRFHAKSPIALRSGSGSFAAANVKFSIFCADWKCFGASSFSGATDGALSRAGRSFGRSKSSVTSLKMRFSSARRCASSIALNCPDTSPSPLSTDESRSSSGLRAGPNARPGRSDSASFGSGPPKSFSNLSSCGGGWGTWFCPSCGISSCGGGCGIPPPSCGSSFCGGGWTSPPSCGTSPCGGGCTPCGGSSMISPSPPALATSFACSTMASTRSSPPLSPSSISPTAWAMPRTLSGFRSASLRAARIESSVHSVVPLATSRA